MALGRGLAVRAGDGHDGRCDPAQARLRPSSTKWAASRRSIGRGHQAGQRRRGTGRRARRPAASTEAGPLRHSDDHARSPRAAPTRRPGCAAGVSRPAVTVRPRSARPSGPAATDAAVTTPTSGHHDASHRGDDRGRGEPGVDRGGSATSGPRTGSPTRTGSAPAGRPGAIAGRPGTHEAAHGATVTQARPSWSRAGHRDRLTSEAGHRARSRADDCARAAGVRGLGRDEVTDAVERPRASPTAGSRPGPLRHLDRYVGDRRRPTAGRPGRRRPAMHVGVLLGEHLHEARSRITPSAAR